MSFINPSVTLNIAPSFGPSSAPNSAPSSAPNSAPSIASNNLTRIPVITAGFSPSSTFTSVTCPNVPHTEFTFTMVPSDLGVVSLDNFWFEISNNLNIRNSLSVGYTFSPYGTSITLPMNLTPSPKNEMWLFVASLFTIFQFNLGRICNVDMVPSSTSDIQSIVITCTITDQQTNNFPNDNLTSQCLVLWIINFLQKYDPLYPNNFSQSPPQVVTANPMCYGSTFTPKVNGRFNENFKNIKFKNINMLNEDFTGVSIVSASSATPYSILDYVFLYAYPVSFIGAMLFSIIQYISIKPVTIIGNDQAVIVINAYIAICGFLSFIYWYQAYNFTSFNQFIDDISWIYNLQTIKPTSSS
jgi:hypothetical protein